MRSILEKALVALINEDKETADKLFHDFVLERSRQIHESIRQGEDFVLDEGLEDSIAVEDMFSTPSQIGEMKGPYGDDDDPEDYVEDDNELDEDEFQEPNKAELIDMGYEVSKLSPHMLNNHEYERGGQWWEVTKFNQNGDAVTVARVPGVEIDAWDAAQEHANGGGSMVEGKSYKRNRDDDADEKKKQDKDQSKARQQKREPVEEGKTFKHDDEDGDAKDKKKADQKKRDEKKSKREPVEEGQLTATQGDDGVLTIVHEPEGAAVPMAAPVVEPVVGGEMAPETDMDMDLDPGVDEFDSVSDDEFSALGESLVSELEKIIVTNKDGEEAGNGKAVKQERHSPTPNRNADDRVDHAAPVEVKGDEHNGFDRETSPSVEGSKVRQNAFKQGKDSLDAVKDGGDTKALLNQLGDDKSAKSPIAGK